MAVQRGKTRPPLLNIAILAVILTLTVYVLIVAKNFLIPFVIAVVFWYLIDVLAATYQKIPLGRWQMPRWLGLVLAILSFVIALVVLVNFITANFTPESLQQVAKDFQTNLGAVIKRALDLLPFQNGAPTLAQLVEKIDFGVAVGGIVSAVTSIAGDIGIIIVYVIFLLLEQITFRRKFDSLIKDRERRERVRKVIERIGEDIQLYIRIKFLLALIAAGISYAIMRSVDLRFAEVWGILIFFMAWIPTVGSIIGLIFPLVFSIVQFTSIGPILVVALGVGITQSVIANIIEPRLMGSSLNLSPLVVIVSLVLWGTIWGVTGMFLSVPIMVIMMIVLSNFPATRPLAVLLSSDGKLRH